ncbi:uncharacterized protein LOC110451518 [Mizuhopecten yessoensis]|uniref:uncharacterized protein LOC110451518 n=1 Tax=Mizuhopecten yessoensis TaxID=6573 RepID=UPI000B45BF58|nr:uncharacterized protein LOC110451518 [Mizuhopecten yessoensis]
MDVTTLQMLTYKTVMLLSLSTGQRAQSVHALNIQNETLMDKQVKCRFGDILKTTRPGFHQSEITLERFNETHLCVIQTLREYMYRRELLRDNYEKTGKLFISFHKPHLPVTKSTIFRWIKDIKLKTGVDMTIFTPHSTRASSTSAAINFQLTGFAGLPNIGEKVLERMPEIRSTELMTSHAIHTL